MNESGIESNIPRLVVTTYGEGRISTFMSDLALHWCAGLVDWGELRIEKDRLEIGHLCVNFVSQLIAWTVRYENT